MGYVQLLLLGVLRSNRSLNSFSLEYVRGSNGPTGDQTLRRTAEIAMLVLVLR